MSDQDLPDPHPPSWEGHRFPTHSESDRREAVSRACDYRGDVTLHLNTGEQVVGYVYDRQEQVSEPYLKLFLPDQAAPATVKYQDIAEIEFSGEDTAFGRSWEDWAQKWQKPKVP